MSVQPTSEDLSLLLTYFPAIDLPVTITFTSHHAFSQENRPLPEMLSDFFLATWEGETPDEFTEYIPGFHFEEKNYFGLVYWKAGLLHYAYVLVIMDKKGRFIERKVLAETEVADTQVRQGVAMITADGEIFMVESEHDGNDDLADPTQSVVDRYRIKPDGEIEHTVGS